MEPKSCPRSSNVRSLVIVSPITAELNRTSLCSKKNERASPERVLTDTAAREQLQWLNDSHLRVTSGPGPLHEPIMGMRCLLLKCCGRRM